MQLPRKPEENTGVRPAFPTRVCLRRLKGKCEVRHEQMWSAGTRCREVMRGRYAIRFIASKLVDGSYGQCPADRGFFLNMYAGIPGARRRGQLVKGLAMARSKPTVRRALTGATRWFSRQAFRASRRGWACPALAVSRWIGTWARQTPAPACLVAVPPRCISAARPSRYTVWSQAQADWSVR